MKITYLLILLFILNSSSIAQTIYKSSIDSGGATATAGGLEILFTIGEVNVQEYSTPTLSVSEGFINAYFKIKIDPKVLLQGPMLNPSTVGLMNDNLRIGNYIPITSPYRDSATCNISVFNVTGNNAIVDWVWVELRAANDTTKLINGRSALLQRDGDVVDVDGFSTIQMQAAPTNYYVIVNHRNHLATMSNSTIALREDTSSVVDFKDSAFSNFGSFSQIQLTNGSMALWAGDSNGTTKIRFSGANNSTNVIKDAVLADPSNGFNSVTFTSSGYLMYDCDLNGLGKFSGAGNDSNFIKDNVLSHPANGFGSPTFTISATVPPEN